MKKPTAAPNDAELPFPRKAPTGVSPQDRFSPETIAPNAIRGKRGHADAPSPGTRSRPRGGAGAPEVGVWRGGNRPALGSTGRGGRRVRRPDAPGRPFHDLRRTAVRSLE